MTRFFFRLFAFCMALYWVPATGHCRIEALGAEFASCSDGCHDQAPSGANHDGCSLVESGLYKTGTNTLKVAPVTFVLCAGLICWPPPEPNLETASGLATVDTVRPLEWVPTWHFVQRAAPSPRAPSLV